MKTWEFIEVRRNLVCKKSSDDPYALYSYTINEKGNDWWHGAGLFYKELKPLMFHFGVSGPEKLVGKSFESPREDADSALNLLIVQIRHGGEYESPSPQKLYDALAESLAKLQIPDFSNVDDETVCDAFAEWFSGFKMKEEWFSWLKIEIWKLGNGRFLLERADHKEFKVGVKEPAEYLTLTDQGLPHGRPPGHIKRLVIGPYSKPAFFDY